MSRQWPTVELPTCGPQPQTPELRGGRILLGGDGFISKARNYIRITVKSKLLISDFQHPLAE